MSEDWMKDGVMEALDRAHSSNSALTTAELQEEVGIGAHDLGLTLEELRTEGRAVQVAPGVWELGTSEDGGVPEPAEEDSPVPLAEQPGVDEVPAPLAPARAPAPARPLTAADLRAMVGGQDDVRLTRGMVSALDEAALGRLVKAGIDGAGERGDFVLRVTP